MSFIAAAVIGSVGAIAGGAIAAKGARDAGRTAAAGAREEIAFNKESRDLVRGDQKPYREAGYKALDALMSLTGLGGGSGGGQAPQRPRQDNFDGMPLYKQMQRNPEFRVRQSQYANRALGGPTGQGQMYNINELGPESVYTGGSYTRNPNPMTIDGQTGYVQPNIQGRALGGFTEDIGVGGPYGGLPNRPPPTPVQAPPGQAPQTGANTTAINPQTGYPNENPGGEPGGYQFETDPGYQFRFSEGQRALDRGAAARGGLLSGGYARKAIRYGQGFASNEFTNVYNRIANIAGLGQTANQASGNATMQGGQLMGNAASNAANASAYGQIGAGNAWANAGNQIAQLPWDKVFKPGNQDPDPTRYGTSVYGG